MFRMLHTADWHLGQKLDKFDRQAEHEAFLEWLLERMTSDPVDALVVCGDIFDASNPPVNALRLFISFVVKARQVCPHIVLLAGNHDSAGRLDALQPVLHELGVVMIGAIPQEAGQCIVRLSSRDQSMSVLLAAVPYLRGADLPPGESAEKVAEGVTRVTAAIARIYEQVLVEMEQQRQSDEPVVLTGHLFSCGGKTTDESERPVQLEAGSIQAVSGSIFGSLPAYVALGHLHRCQTVEGAVPICYSGSPLPLSFAEAAYPHSLMQVSWENGNERPLIQQIPVPRSVDVIDLCGTPVEVRQQLEQLVHDFPHDGCRQAIVRVNLKLDQPQPELRNEILDLVEQSNIAVLAVRRVVDVAPGLGEAFENEIELEQLTPLDVLTMKYRQEYNEEVPADIMQAYQQLLDEILSADNQTRIVAET